MTRRMSEETRALALTTLVTAVDIMKSCDGDYHYCQGCFADGLDMIRAVLKFLDSTPPAK